MRPLKSCEELKFITALLTSVQNRYSEVFTRRALRLTISKIERRVATEGLGFLTKTLPRLGKATQRCLSSDTKLTQSLHRFQTMPGSELPKFMGEFFSRVFDPTGAPLSCPDAASVLVLQDLCFCFYKTRFEYDQNTEQQVLNQFIKTEADLTPVNTVLNEISTYIERGDQSVLNRLQPDFAGRVICRARELLKEALDGVELEDIRPKHGPGSVANRERPWHKFDWTSIPPRTRERFPVEQYFYCSLNHALERLSSLMAIKDTEPSARVILVPKDSRGPRLISAEPKEFQWLQQGIARSIVNHVERHRTTKYNVFFTDQGPNQRGALLGSSTGRYATLDLKEASDRVTCGLVRLLFPPDLAQVCFAVRSQSTVLPDGRVVPLQKHAPMGSALCFPILALSVWALLTARSLERDPSGREAEGILVYGDDVVVPTAYAENAIEVLTLFGLQANPSKCCIKGLFRESCGVDAFNGVCVTPIRIKLPLASPPTPGLYCNLVHLVNAYHSRGYDEVCEYLLTLLEKRFHTAIPTVEEVPYGNAPAILHRPDNYKRPRRRWSKSLHRLQTRALTVVPLVVSKDFDDGWKGVLKVLSAPPVSTESPLNSTDGSMSFRGDNVKLLSANEYTERGRQCLRPCWC